MVKSREKWHRIISDLKFPHVFFMRKIHAYAHTIREHRSSSRPFSRFARRSDSKDFCHCCCQKILKLSTSVWAWGDQHAQNTPAKRPAYIQSTRAGSYSACIAGTSNYFFSKSRLYGKKIKRPKREFENANTVCQFRSLTTRGGVPSRRGKAPKLKS